MRLSGLGNIMKRQFTDKYLFGFPVFFRRKEINIGLNNYSAKFINKIRGLFLKM